MSRVTGPICHASCCESEGIKSKPEPAATSTTSCGAIITEKTTRAPATATDSLIAAGRLQLVTCNNRPGDLGPMVGHAAYGFGYFTVIQNKIQPWSVAKYLYALKRTQAARQKKLSAPVS